MLWIVNAVTDISHLERLESKQEKGGEDGKQHVGVF